MKEYKFSTFKKIKFYVSYAVYKLLTVNDVKNGKRNLFISDFVWIIFNIFGREIKISEKYKSSYYETIFGKFYITPDLISSITVSPAFERLDINYLLELINIDVKKKKKILFIDIGANFGLYTVLVGNKFKRYKKIDIFSFEPGTWYLSLPAFELLEKNVTINKLKNVKLFKVGLGSKNAKKQNERGIITRRLDDFLDKKTLNKYDVIYIKMDVDSYEKEVLLGAKNFLSKSKHITLLVEDFLDNSVVKELPKHFTFLEKITPYNSFWIKDE